MQPVAPNNNPAPTTDFNTAYGELGNVYDPQAAQVNTALAALPSQQQAAQSSLDQAKANAFRDIGTTSNARGLLYSGYQPYQQNSYTTNTYNPAVTDLNNKVTSQTQSLQQKLTDINQTRSNAAQSLVSDTQTAQAAAAKSAASVAKSAFNAAQPTTNQIANKIQSNLVKVTGPDGHVSPEDYAQAYIDWINNGQSASSFNSNFGSLKDPNNGYYNYAITQALKRAK